MGVSQKLKPTRNRRRDKIDIDSRKGMKGEEKKGEEDHVVLQHRHGVCSNLRQTPHMALLRLVHVDCNAAHFFSILW